MIDSSGFRLNVGIILSNEAGQLFWGKRIYQDAWQFPQGGVDDNETIEHALYRELYEEIGLSKNEVKLIAQTRNWLTYRLPKHLVRGYRQPLCIGQKQKWFLLQLVGPETSIQFGHEDKPEFDAWQWVTYWYPLYQVVAFKREVYRKALIEFSPILNGKYATRNHLDPLDKS